MGNVGAVRPSNQGEDLTVLGLQPNRGVYLEKEKKKTAESLRRCRTLAKKFTEGRHKGRGEGGDYSGNAKSPGMTSPHPQDTEKRKVGPP